MRKVYEALFSLHLAFAGTSMVFRASVVVAAPFSRVEARINRFLHISQTDFVRGYLACWIPSVIVALLIWAFLRIFSRSPFTQEFLRSVAGIVVLFTPPAF